MRFFISLLFVALSANAFSTKSFAQQRWNPNNPPNTYRTKGNPYYWQNRKPDAAYWQQDVYYKINATIDETTDIITGEQTLRYWNNSPDTLYYAFFHLYQQAFVKGGHVQNLNINNNFKQKFGKYEAQGLGTVVSKWLVNGDSVRVDQDFSVVKVYLPKSLMPGDSVDFQISFKTYFDSGTQRRRMKKFDAWGFTHYDGVHWYPRISVYDRKMGWDTQQHIGKEFYGDYGTYEVSLNFSSNYVVEGTGMLQNRNEVLPQDLRQRLDISNFLRKPWNSAPSTITPYNKDERKTWKYYAENVHDFAFTADPTYRIGEAEWNGVRVIALVQEPHAAGWYDAAPFTAKVIETYSKEFGMYAWNKIIVADARDGMEYPMLTLDGGYSPAYYDLLAHEVGHMWFFGMVGNNETYRALLDEGFTQFIESYGLQKIIGTYMPEPRLKGYEKHFTEPNKVIDSEVYYGYLRDAIKNDDPRINQHSDAFNGALNHGGGYGHVYYKTATMLWNLQYVLGDSLFSAAMKHYFNQWKFCHPYTEDFRASIINYTHVDLNWFFDQWLESDKRIDYKVSKIKRKGNMHEITFKRLGRMEMPLDVMVVNRDNDTSYVHIPNNWFVKTVDSGWSVAPKWYGWDKLHPTYTLKLESDKKIRDVVIDPSNRLADVNLMNNALQTPVKWRFDSQIANPPSRYNYIVKWRPDVWYNSIDGIKAGLHFNGGYMKYKHLFSLTAWWNTSILNYPNQRFTNGPLADFDVTPPTPFNFNFSYTNPLRMLSTKTRHTLKLHWLDGLAGGFYRWDISLNDKTTLYAAFKSMYRPEPAHAEYPLFNQTTNLNDSGLLLNIAWLPTNFNNTLRVGINRKYNYIRGNGNIDLNFVSSTVFSDYNYAYANFIVTNYNRLGKFDVNTRFFVQYSDDALPGESALYAAGANPEEMFENKYTRSRGIVPDEWVTFGAETNHFQYGGGLNLRGYNGYVIVEQQGDDLNNYYLYKSNSGASGSVEIGFNRVFKFAPRFLNWFKLDPYLFADGGVIGYDNAAGDRRISYPRVDAGIGAALTIKRFWILDEVQPLTIRFDMPLFLNRPPFAEEDYLKFRWLFSVNRAF